MQTLPIDRVIPEFLDKINKSSNVILTASPGSGKTTRVPPALMKTLDDGQYMIVLVPKRLAAVSAVYRVAEENKWSVGNEIGYQVRFDSRISDKTKLIFMTEGVFIKRCADEAFWQGLKYVILDEFHERSSAIDIALGICTEKQILGHSLKTVIMSATLNLTKLQEYLPDSETVSLEDRPFKLTIEKSVKSQRLVCDDLFAEHLYNTLLYGLRKTSRDVLIFLPGLGEINFLERFFKKKKLEMEVRILHGSVKLEEQREILQPSSNRRVILSTNVAESSITIPSIDFVIDSGLVKKSVTEEKVGFSRLEISRISLFSATQRAGRAARTGDGLCIQLWHELDERSMPEQIEPEIMSSSLLEETLTVLSLGIKKPDQFSWPDKPKKSFEPVMKKLRNWDLIDEDFSLTGKGILVQRCPLEIEKSLLFIELTQKGHARQVADLMSFVESANFDLLNEMPDLNSLILNENGKRIRNQLEAFSKSIRAQNTGHTFKSDAAEIFVKLFPEKIALVKDRNTAVSSLGRGLEPAKFLTAPDTKYLLLLAGREISSAVTKISFALPYTESEFEKYLSENQSIRTEIGIDFEKLKLFKIEAKFAGPFKVSESSRKYDFNSADRPKIKSLIHENFKTLIRLNESYNNLLEKINFISKKRDRLDVPEINIEKLEEELRDFFIDSLDSVESFTTSDFSGAALNILPESVTKILNKTPTYMKLPNGRSVKIDYVSEQAPKVSARVQDFYGIDKHPHICEEKIPITIEMLAPNNRPTQTTGRLDKFWTEGYFELRKELRARYPKHSWPDNPQSPEAVLIKK